MLQLFILLLTGLVTSRAGCPTMCICKHFPREPVPTSSLYYTSVRCDGFNVSGGHLSNSTRVLEVSNVDAKSFSELITLTKSDLPELNSLVITNSIVSNVSELFSGIGVRIKYVTLSHNNLTFLPNFSDELKIVSLDVSNNNISLIPPRTIRTVLEILNLSANSIQKIDSKSFFNLTNLRVLDLSQNNILSLDNQFLYPLVSLQYLNLSHNHIEVLNEKCFASLVRLQQLDVSWNNLARVALGSLQLPSLARLLLAGNPRLGESHEILTGVGQRLHTVDASGTGLKQVPAALTHSIRTLKLAKNAIKMVTCGELDAFPLLQFLDFTSNDVESIEEDATGRLESLSVLYLTGNKLKSIPRSLPEELTVLRAEFNVIEKIGADDLGGLLKLEVLLLNDNKITVVEGGAFSCLHSLATLDLSRNPIKALYPGSLSGPIALQILRLSAIDTVSPAEDVSFPLPAPDHLVSLDLSGSAGLARQLLADTAALAASRELQELDISGADLEFLRSDLLHFLPQLRLMHIKDNRLNCTNLQWLAAWMRRQDQAEYRSVSCASPADLWGTPLLDLQYAETSPIKQINHEKVQDFEGTINLAREATAAEKNSLLGKYVTERTFVSITNGFINSPVNTSHIADKNTSTTDRAQLLASTRNTITDRTELIKKETLALKRPGKMSDTVKSMKKILVSSTGVGVSSLIPVANRRKEYVVTKGPEVSRDLNEPGAIHAKETSDNGSLASAEYPTSPGNNGSTGAPNKSQASLNLAPNERIFNDTSGLVGNNRGENEMQQQQQTINELNMTDNMAEWNASTVKTSMYRNNDDPNRLLHPGMLILGMGVVLGAIALATVAIRFNSRKRYSASGEDSEQIPVASISSVSELW